MNEQRGEEDFASFICNPSSFCRDVFPEREERRQGQGFEGPDQDKLRERALSEQVGSMGHIRERPDTSDLLIRQLREL